MKVSIVIPNWNGAERLRRNLPNVLKVKGVSEIIVVDDASTDGSLKVLTDEFPQVKLIKREINGGFTPTVNLGVSKAEGELIFLLNSDASPEEDCLINALDHFQNKNVFSVGCNVGGVWAWARFKDGFFWHYMADDQGNNPHETLWSSGGSGIFRKSIWDELGGLDTLFSPFYEEDTDLGYRATKRGYINIWEPSSKVEHYKQKGVIEEYFSKKFVSKIAQQHQLLFIWKNITSRKYLVQHIFGLIKMIITHPKYLFIALGVSLSLPEVLRKRQVEKSYAKLTDEEILERYEKTKLA